MHLNLRVAFLATIAWLRPNKMQDHRHDRQEATAKPSQHPANHKLQDESAGLQAVIGEILSGEDHQAAQRKLGAAQLRIAKGLNRITAIGAIVGAISSLGIIGSLIRTKMPLTTRIWPWLLLIGLGSVRLVQRS